MKVFEQASIFTQQLWNGLGFAGHCLAVEMQAAVGRSDPFAKLHTEFGRVEERAVLGAQRLHC